MNTTATIAGIAALVALLVRYYRSPVVQSWLPERFQWANLSLLSQVGIVFGLSLIGSLTESYASGGATLALAFAKAWPIALGAIGFHKVTKDAGELHTMRSLKDDPAYEPGSIRTILHPVFPIALDALSEPPPEQP